MNSNPIKRLCSQAVLERKKEDRMEVDLVVRNLQPVMSSTVPRQVATTSSPTSQVNMSWSRKGGGLLMQANQQSA